MAGKAKNTGKDKDQAPKEVKAQVKEVVQEVQEVVQEKEPVTVGYEGYDAEPVKAAVKPK